MGRYHNAAAASDAPIGTVAELPFSAPVVGDYVRTGQALKRSDYPELAAAYDGVTTVIGFESSNFASTHAYGMPGHLFDWSGKTYAVSQGPGFYEILPDSRLREVKTTGLPAGTSRVFTFDGKLYAARNGVLYESTDLVSWRYVLTGNVSRVDAITGATDQHLYLAGRVGSAAADSYRMAVDGSVAAVPRGAQHTDFVYVDEQAPGKPLLSIVSTSPNNLEVSRDGGATWSVVRALNSMGWLLSHACDGMLYARNANGLCFSSDGWLNSAYYQLNSAPANPVRFNGHYVVHRYEGSTIHALYAVAIAQPAGHVTASSAFTVNLHEAAWQNFTYASISAQHGNLAVINGKLALMYSSEMFLYPAGTGSTVVDKTLATRQTRVFGGSPLAALRDGRLLSVSSGLFCFFDPATGEFSGTTVRAGAPGEMMGFSASYYKGFAVIGGEVIVYWTNGSASVSSITAFVVGQSMSVAAVSVALPAARDVQSLCVRQLSDDLLLALTASDTTNAGAPLVSRNGYAFTAAQGIGGNYYGAVLGVTRSGVIVLFLAQNGLTSQYIYTSTDNGRSWVLARTTSGVAFGYATDDGVYEGFAENKKLTSQFSGQTLRMLPNAPEYPASGTPQFGGFQLDSGVFLQCFSDRIILLDEKNMYASAAIGGSGLQNYPTTVFSSGEDFIICKITGSSASMFVRPMRNLSINFDTHFQLPTLLPQNSQLNVYVKAR